MLKWPADSWDYPWLVNDMVFFGTYYNIHDIIMLGATALTRGFTNGVGQRWLNDVQCTGNENRLIDCPASPIGSIYCYHTEDAGISCPPISMNNSFCF